MTEPVRATYRVQLHAGFTFDDAAALAPYLADLGVSHLYCSPYLQAAPGSTHGYDVVDHTRLNEELGGAEAHARMTEALRAHGLGQVLDIVPNHMAVSGRANAWWWDVLENGPSSKYASYFDIDWDPPERKLIAQVLVPVLGDHYGRVLENGELVLEREDGSFLVRYHEHELPVSPRTVDDVLARAEERSPSDELASLANAFGRLPHALLTDRDSVLERHRDKEVLRQRLADLCEADETIAAAIDEEIKAVNDDVEVLHVLLERQNYRLAFWRTAGRELDYRRFFDITTLVAVRTEEQHVFDDVHALVLQLVRDGVIDGLRVDHVDGLRDPKQYLERLRAAAGPSTYLTVEKILEGEEKLRTSWPVEGTSGYDFLVQVNTLLHDPAGEALLTELYERFTGCSSDAHALAREAKLEIMRTVLAADVERLTAQFAVVAEGHRRYRDHTRSELRDALREVIAGFDVYRTYVVGGADADKVDDEDVEIVSRAVERAVAARPDIDQELFGFLGDLLVLRYEGAAEIDLAERFQQVSAPVMAKAVEDTVFYRFLRLVSLNEVGGEPAEFGCAVADFHERRVADRSNRSLLATSTHDTKRSEDVRARLAAIAEIPEAWAAGVERWSALVGDTGIDRGTEYLAYQTVVGAWPLTVERLQAYLEKATKEAKLQTSWIDADPDYDAAVASFAEALLGNDRFCADVERFLADTGLVEAGQWNSLVQTALKLTCPGVPDLYQGTELWDLSLVDPDNRRPVDYDLRTVLCRNLPPVGAKIDTEAVGGKKLRLIRTLLHLRRDRPELFDVAAGYEPLAVEGPDGDRVVAFSRADGALQVIASRFPLRGPLDGSTTYADVLAGRPVAVLVEGKDVLSS